MNTPKLDKFLVDASGVVVRSARLNLSKQRKNSSGALQKSLRTKLIKSEQRRVIEFYMESYGPDVDMGRDGTKAKRRNRSSLFYTGSNAGRFPNITAIKKWTGTKPVRPRPYNGRTLSIDSMVYLIGKKIKEQGIKPSMFFTDAYNKHQKDIVNGAVAALSKDLDNQLNKIVK